MKKGGKEMLRTILSNQELIMKALKIELPVKQVVSTKSHGKKAVAKPAKSAPKAKLRKPVKKIAAK
ncbi:MAG: hypothetical protein Q8M29_18760 [Bacteroidota bacterium]|nr:hypothetical protein [Bacteroidota bacterium]